ncbi:MAG TPA: 4Fe-4S dicluster domain-containing protein [Deltaproteobacteria bacterium]|nr:4Fe-4S dicluster domain-containing protein [Deltaproteobacteria bacterium]
MSEKTIRPERPSERAVHVRRIHEYSDVPPAYLEIAQNYTSPWLMGPPLCDELIDLVGHMFDADEAEVMRHIKPFRLGKKARSIAKSINRPVDETANILRRLSDEKCIIMGMGPRGNESYFFVPLFPGTMENILFRNSREKLTPWHERFAVLFDKLYNTGYMTDYTKPPAEVVRFLPVNESIASDARVWPSDKLEEIMDPFKTFSVTYCQCRLTMDLKGEACGKPLETCLMMGAVAEQMIQKGRMRRVDKQEALDIKRNAEAHGLVTWVNNVDSLAGSNVCCSCCSCCCYMLRMTKQFGASTMIAPPHFRPQHLAALCKACGACAHICPTGAITVDPSRKSRTYNMARCLGCGLCVGTCAQRALTLQEAPDGRKPPRNAIAYLRRILPNIIKSTLYAARSHKAG